MKILVPRMEYDPSALRVAAVLALPTSLPACGSVRHIVPPHWPPNIRAQYSAFCSGVPNDEMTSDAPYARPGYIANAVLAPLIISSTITCSAWGAPAPPYSASTAIDFHPAS